MTDFTKMDAVELKVYKQETYAKMEEKRKELRARKKYLNMARIPGAKYPKDEEEKRIERELQTLSAEYSLCKQYIREHQDTIRANALKKEREAKMERMKIEEEIAEYEIERAKEIEKLRPAAPRIWFGSEFRKCTDTERRLVSMMAREIGLKRYQELRKIAFYDEKHQNNRYYTGSNTFNHGRGEIVE